MKKTLHNVSFIIGFILLLGGILCYGLNKFEIVHIENPKLSGVIIILGIGLIVGGACELFIKTNRQMQIEARDERNIVIATTAKSFAFDILIILLSVTTIILVLFDYISMGIFFVLFTIYVVSQMAFVLKLWYLQKLFD